MPPTCINQTVMINLITRGSTQVANKKDPLIGKSAEKWRFIDHVVFICDPRRQYSSSIASVDQSK